MNCVCKKYSLSISTISDIRKRSEAEREISKTLVSLETGNWREILRCAICGQLWCREYPYSECHGGGPPCSYHINTNDPRLWLSSEEYLTERIRKKEEDAIFFDSLGPEIGPEICKRINCDSKRIKHSVFCRKHHFEEMKKMK